MPKVYRKTDITTGHACYPPTQPATYSPDTFASGGLNVVRFGDTIIKHCCPDGSCHTGTYIGKKCEVYVNEQYIQLQGDPTDCGDHVDTHDPTWDCCSEPMPMIQPKISVNPTTLNFGKRIVNSNKSTPVDIGSIIGKLDLPFIPIIILNVGGPVLIVQFAIYGPINPQQKHITCNPVDGTSPDEYPDFVFKNVCWPLGLNAGESSIFYVNFIPKTIGPKIMYINIFSQPEQETKKIILKGEGISI